MSKFLDEIGLGHLIEKIKQTFIRWEDTSAATTIDIDTTPTADSDNLVTSGGVKAAIPTASSTTPIVDGTAAVGSSNTYARADHVHPTDTSRASSTHVHGNITNGGDITATAPTIANGDQLVINDDSESKITNGPTFDGTTTNQALTPKGTWEGFLPSTGGELTGDLIFRAAAGLNSPSLIFQRGTLSDNYNDWMIQDRGGYLYFDQRGSGATEWANLVYFDTTGNIHGYIDWSLIKNKPSIPSAPGTLNTNNTTAQTVSSSEALSGAISLHKVSKTGNYEDLLDKPDIPIINAVTETYSSTAADTTTPFSASIWRVDLSDKITELYSGLTILIKVPVAGNGTYGTLLRVDGVDSADDSSENLYPVCANVNTMVSTRYAVGCIIALTFDATLAGQTLYYNSASAYTTTASGTGWTKPGCWKIADYSTGDTTTGREGYYHLRPYAGQAVYRYKYLMEGADGRLYPIVTTNQTSGTSVTKTPTTVGLRPWKIWYYSHTDTVSAGAAFGAQRVYPEMYTTTATYNFNAATGTYAWIFLLGSYNKDTDLFTLDTGNNYYKFVRYNAAINWASSLTAGKYYILLGSSYSTTNYVQLFNVNPFYYFDGTNLIPVTTKIAKDSAPIQSISVNGTTLTITNGNVDLTISGGSLPNDYEMESSDTNEDLALEPGDTYDRAFAKIEKSISDNSYVVAAALNDLNLRVTSNTANIATKQDTLVSGTNIKTVNNLSLLGSGNIDVGGGAQADWLESDESSDSYIKNKPTIPSAVTETTVSNWGFTKNAGTITGITMNGASKGTSGVIDLGTVLTSHLDISGKADKSAAIGSLSLAMDSTNYKITLSGTKVDGTSFTVSDVIDLPLESVVVSGSYDSNTKKVILTLKSGSTVDFSVADLVSGLLSEITSSNKLSADLVQDGTTNKVYTATEKTKLAGIAAGAEVNVQSDWNLTTTTADDYIKNKPTIDLEEDSSDDTVTITLGDKTATVAKIEALEKNELVISAAFNDLNTRINNKLDELVSGTNIKTVNNQSLLGSGNIEIQGGSNVLADWDESDSTDDAYIKNKPVINTITVNGSTINSYKYVTLIPNNNTSAGIPVLVSGAIYENNPGNELAPYTVPNWMTMSATIAQINNMSGTIAGVASAIANMSGTIASAIASMSGGIADIGFNDGTHMASGYSYLYGSGIVYTHGVDASHAEIVVNDSVGNKIEEILNLQALNNDGTLNTTYTGDQVLLTAAATDVLYHNVQADWDESDESNDSFIRNKPTVIETVKVNGTALTPDANKAVNIDLSGYDKTPLIIEVGDSVNTVPAGTYASITTALSNGRKVFVKVYTDQGEGNINYHILPLVEKYYVEDDEDSYYFSASEYSNAFIATVFNNDDFGYSVTDLAQAHHNHGNIQWDGSLQFGDITVANGDKLVVTDASDNSSVARTSITFDASTTTKALTPKGTWETFYQKPSTGIPSNDLASAVLTSLGLADTALLSYTETDPIFSASAAAGITSSDITNWNGKTSNVGTVTGVKMNGTTNNPTSGVVDLGTVITSETSLSKGNTSGSGNAVTDISVNGHQITLTKGSTFLTSETLLSKGTTSGSGNAVTDISVSNHQITLTKGSTFLTAHLDIKTINSTSLVGTGNVTINELPSVTSSDNGKILMVVNGAWSLVTPTAIYSGSSTPSNSSGNNGDLYLQTS